MKKYNPAGLTSSIRIATSAVKDYLVAYTVHRQVNGNYLSGKLIHEHLWDRRTEPLSVRQGAEIARRADRGEAHEQFT